MTRASTNDAVRRQFGAAATAYATSSVHASGPDLTALVEAAALTGAERVLDLGCGAGHTALALAPRAASVTAVDLTAEMLAVAAGLARQRNLANVTFELADVAALPFPAASFDVVVSRYAAHHFAAPERALAEAARVLRPGGAFLLVDTVAPEDPALDTFFNAVELLRDDSHVRNWRGSEWLRMFQGAGFEATIRERFAVGLDGGAWVARMQTPPSRVAMLRELFATASAARRAGFEIRDTPWGLSIPVALIAAVSGQ
jgi:SAM-dependent methyltransferase